MSPDRFDRDTRRTSNLYSVEYRILMTTFNCWRRCTSGQGGDGSCACEVHYSRMEFSTGAFLFQREGNEVLSRTLENYGRAIIGANYMGRLKSRLERCKTRSWNFSAPWRERTS